MMELRKDPITRSWVITGDEVSDNTPRSESFCRFCPDSPQPAQLITNVSGISGVPWAARSVVHPTALYHIEGDPARRGDGIYDRMRGVGAHEVLVENPRHERHLWHATDAEIEQFLLLAAQRIQDLKRDGRFKYISVFKDYGNSAGQEFAHPTSQLMATTFVPRRVLYELRAAKAYYQEKERCVFCDIVRQEERQGKRMVDTQGDYVAFCPYASRVPYETWIMWRKHNYLFEQLRPGANRHHLAALLGRVLRRLTQISDSYHLVVHTAPNTIQPKGELTDYWKTLPDDFHWHIEILPIVEQRSKSYSIKEVYFNALAPERAAEHLRQLDPNI